MSRGIEALPCQRGEFSLPDGLHYLNCAYMSPLPRAVEGTGVRALGRKRNPVEIGPRDFFAGADRIRRAFAELVGSGEPERVAIVPAASYGLATAAANLPLGGDQRVVIVHEQFPSNVYTWMRACGESGAELVRVAPPAGAENRGEAWNARILEAIDTATAVVAIPHVHWADGTRFDLETIGARAREVGAALVVDGTQSVGALTFDVGRIRPDALVCAGYKWLLGPYAIGAAWYGPRFDGGRPLEENWINRRGSEEFSGLVHYVDAYQPGAARYDVGEKSHFVLAPMLGRAIEMLLEWRVDRIQATCSALLDPVLERVVELGYRVEEPSFRAGHLVGIRMPVGVEAARVRSALEERNVHVSLRGDAIRVSPHVYNDEDDLAALAEALASVA